MVEINDEIRKKSMVIFIFVILFFSIISYSLMFITPENNEIEIPIYVRTPLSEKEISQIVERNGVLVQYFWSYDCEDCYEYELELRDIVYSFNGSVILEALDTYNYPDLPYLDLPYLRIIGSDVKEFVGSDIPNSTEVKRIICDTFFTPPPVC